MLGAARFYRSLGVAQVSHAVGGRPDVRSVRVTYRSGEQLKDYFDALGPTDEKT